MNCRRRLFFHSNPYDLEKTKNLFFNAVKSNISHHSKHCSEYAKLLDFCCFNISNLKSESDLHKIPVLPTLYFKRNKLLSISEKDLTLKATSSGTKGQHSVIGFDRESLFYGIVMMLRFFSYHNVISLVPTNYIVLGYEPSSHTNIGAIKTAYGTTKFAPALHREYALKDTGTEYEINIDGIKKALIKYSKQLFPVRFVGFPSYMYFLVKTLKENGISLKLSRNSKILLGGGWKQFSDEKIDQQSFYELVKETLGIDKKNILEFYSAVEHPLPYCKCSCGHFHVPIYSRVIIRDAVTLEPVENGQPGILSSVSPLMSSVPLTSVITDDIAVLHEDEPCGCGIKTPYFELIGRAGVKQIKVCTADAAEIMNGMDTTKQQAYESPPMKKSSLIFGKLINQHQSAEQLDNLSELILQTKQSGSLSAETVVSACDRLSKLIKDDEFLPLLISLGIPEYKAHRELSNAKNMLSREYLEKRLESELGGLEEAEFTPYEKEYKIRHSYEPLGVLLHIVAGNVDALPVFSVIEGLLTGNINILKLPGTDNGLSVSLLQKLIDIEPKLSEYIYVFDYPSQDVQSLKKMADASDAVIIWGGDSAVSSVRNLTVPNTKIIEWGHKISFAYVSGKQVIDEELESIAYNICDTNQLFCSSCQGIYVDTDDFSEVKGFAEKFLDILDKQAKVMPLGSDIFLQAQKTLEFYTEELESAKTKKQVYKTNNCSVIAYEDSALVPSYMYRSCWIKPLPQGKILPELLKHKNHLQTMALVCEPESRNDLESIFAKTGIVRIAVGSNMSDSYCTMPHDGEFSLRRYVKIMSVEHNS